GNVETLTDSRGHFGLSVPTPRPTVPDMMGTDTLTYEKPGYKTVIFENFGISSEEMGGIADGMEKGSGVVRHNETHKLMQNPGANQEEPQSARPGSAGLSPELYRWLGSPGTSFSLSAEAVPQAITVPGMIVVGSGGSSTTS